MNESPEKEMDELMRGIAEELDYATEDEAIERPRKRLGSESQRKTLVLWGGVILLLIVLVALLFGGSDRSGTEKTSAIHARLDQIEKRLEALEAMDGKITKLEKQEQALTQSISKANSQGRSLTGRLDKLIQELDILKQRSAPVAAKADTPPAAKTTDASASEGRYHVVRSGDSLYRIAQQYGMSVEALRRLNNISSKQAIYPGQKILVAKGSPQ